MNRSMLAVGWLLFVAACGGGSNGAVTPTIVLQSGTGSIDATITNVKVGAGTLYCSLHNNGDGFPGRSPIIDGDVAAAAGDASMPCAYKGLTPGEYAISVYQDENDDGVLDTNFFGAPTEGYGASNNNLPATSAPTWDDSKFTVGDGADVVLVIDLKR